MVPGDVELNENLAQFIGDQGAEAFFRRRGGDQDPALLEAAQRRRDTQLMNAALADIQESIDELRYYRERFIGAAAVRGRP